MKKLSKSPTNFIIDTYNAIADTYSDKYFDDKFDLPFIQKFLNYLPKKSSILDIGCGSGQFSKFMIKHGFNVTGIDLSEKMLTIARKKNPTTTFLKMNMLKTNFKNETFDGILSAYSLIHIPQKKVEEALKEFHRVLKKDGYLLLITQRGKSDQVVVEPFDKSKKMFFNFFQSESLKSKLINNHFKIIKQEIAHVGLEEEVAEEIIYTIVQK